MMACFQSDFVFLLGGAMLFSGQACETFEFFSNVCTPSSHLLSNAESKGF